MATRKKTVKQEVPKEESVKEIKNAEPQKLGYTGTVKVSVKRGNSIISSKTYKNNGSNRLFLFLHECLVGSYNKAEGSRPSRIKLYNSISTGSEEELTALTNYIPGNDFEVSNANGESIALLHFTIPKSFFISIDKLLNKVRLYPKNSIDEKDWSAECNLTEAIDIRNLSENTTLIIEWSLKVSN